MMFGLAFKAAFLLGAEIIYLIAYNIWSSYAESLRNNSGRAGFKLIAYRLALKRVGMLLHYGLG